MSFEKYVNELNGYLLSLQRLNGHGYVFAAHGFENFQDFEKLASKITSEKLDTYQIDHKAITANLERMLFNGILSASHITDSSVRSKLGVIILEDIGEYFGLMSTSLNIKGVFYPLIRGTVYQLNDTKMHDADFFAFWVKIENCYVLAYFRKLSKSSYKNTEKNKNHKGAG